MAIPGLFAQNKNNSSRDYTKAYYWGKNQFNSSFPASLVAYMSNKGIKPVYIKTDESNNISHGYISGAELFGIDPMSPDAFYNFEAGYNTYDLFYTGEREKIDLVMIDRVSQKAITGLEIKLTALPDSTTQKYTEDKYSCEIVVRPPTINFLACSICDKFREQDGRNRLKELLGDIRINHWEEIAEVLPEYGRIKDAIARVSSSLQSQQTPLIIQPVWKTTGSKPILAPDCLDVFVWSNMAVIQMCDRKEDSVPKTISRAMRATIWLYLMLFEYSVYGQFDYKRIVRLHSYNIANDKAFALNGTASYPFLKCKELTHPRIHRSEIKNIILGGGQNLLSPERRFDAAIVYSPELFNE
ncbi:MAG: HindVP family restriction endonuclease [Muribaculaceae bacterium]|nr:HindVP family restriction endonuclease [Muribaculaceae bacterium]